MHRTGSLEAEASKPPLSEIAVNNKEARERCDAHPL